MSEQVRWNPWHGCHKVSEGCRNCWMHSIDAKYERDGNIVAISTSQFGVPIRLDRYHDYKYPSGTLFTTCFCSDFFISEADAWRGDAWDIIRERSDCMFLILTKRPERVMGCLPSDWGITGYQNVILAVSCENQHWADIRVPIIMQIPCLKHLMFCAPLLEKIDLSRAIELEIDEVNVGGENCKLARPCQYEWVEDMYNQCLNAGNVKFQFWATGSNFWKDGVRYNIRKLDVQKDQARRSGLIIE